LSEHLFTAQLEDAVKTFVVHLCGGDRVFAFSCARTQMLLSNNSRRAFIAAADECGHRVLQGISPVTHEELGYDSSESSLQTIADISPFGVV
jgi:hypothetical protein